ncbi:hypothetical protein GCM10029992_19660 [Glycomyces albus]
MRVSTVSSSATGTAVWAMIGPVSTPESQMNRVAPASFTRLERLAGAVHAREGRQQRVVGVDVAAGEGLQEARSAQLEESGRDDQVGLVAGDGLGERGVPLLAGGEVAHLAHEGGDAGVFGALQPVGAVAVGPDGDDLGPVVGVA